MKTIDYYLDAAKDNQELRSDLKLGAMLGLKNSAISQFRTKKSFPADKTMLKIAQLAGEDEQEALINLNIWRNMDSPVSVAYAQIMDRFKSAAMFVIACVAFAGVYMYEPAPAHAEVASSDNTLYIMTKFILPGI